MALTLKQLRYFMAAAETGQISHAAMELNISQSAITTAVQGLEAQLGVRLFDRSAQGVVPTIEGARFLNHARNILAAVEDAERLPLGQDRQVSGRLRLGTTYTVAGYFMSRHYARFRRAHPDIQIEMMEMPRLAVEEGLATGSLDMAVMLVSNLANSAGLEQETLLRSRRRCRRISPISLSFMVFPRLYVEMPGYYITSKRKNPVKIEGGRFRPPSSGYISGSALALQSLMVMRG